SPSCQHARPPGLPRAAKCIYQAKCRPRDNAQQAPHRRLCGKLSPFLQHQEKQDRPGIQGKAEQPSRYARAPLSPGQAHQCNQNGREKDFEEEHCWSILPSERVQPAGEGRVEAKSTIALASPVMVYSAASMLGRNPACVSVALVTGPIEASRTSRNAGWCALSSKSRKFAAVEELVNVTTCGRVE